MLRFNVKLCRIVSDLSLLKLVVMSRTFSVIEQQFTVRITSRVLFTKCAVLQRKVLKHSLTASAKTLAYFVWGDSRSLLPFQQLQFLSEEEVSEETPNTASRCFKLGLDFSSY